MDGLISHIQRYATKDGPGLRTTAFLMGCNLRCAWCANPEAMLPGVKAMHEARLCTLCGCCCQAARPEGSIAIADGRLVIDRQRCRNLPEMADACPYDAWRNQGERLSGAALGERLLRDEAFYRQSGGGVTFSGGEPMLQPGFAAEAMDVLKRAGVHVALDTAGDWAFEAAGEVLSHTDLVLLDIKAMDEHIHRRCTGAGNARILDNARRLADGGMPLIVRMVLVPGWNDQMHDIEARLRFVRSLGGAVRQLDILKHHRLGLGKYRQLGLPCPAAGAEECPDSLARRVLSMAEGMGIRATIDG